MKNNEEVKKVILNGVTCKCGRPSVEFDSWFNWYPCKLHKWMTPVQYSKWEPKNDK